jgi:hypothetical protein
MSLALLNLFQPCNGFVAAVEVAPPTLEGRKSLRTSVEADPQAKRPFHHRRRPAGSFSLLKLYDNLLSLAVVRESYKRFRQEIKLEAGASPKFTNDPQGTDRNIEKRREATALFRSG